LTELDRYFITITFRPYFRLRHEVGPRRSGRIGNECNTSPGLYWRC